MLVGTPTITLPNEFMRSNVVAGAYRQMKVINPPIARDINHYINLSVDLANNKKANINLRNDLKKLAKMHLFNDLEDVKKFERFLSKTIKEYSSLEDGCVIT